MMKKQRKVDSCNIFDADFVVQFVDDDVVPQVFYSFLPETIDQWKFCFMDWIYMWKVIL